jgi:hypothetical protein
MGDNVICKHGRWTYPKHQVTMSTTFCMVACNNSSVLNMELLCVTLLVPGILRWLICFIMFVHSYNDHNNEHINCQLYVTFYFKSQHLSYIHNILRSIFNPHVMLHYILYYAILGNNKYHWETDGNVTHRMSSWEESVATTLTNHK